jgi:hypothetical protein
VAVSILGGTMTGNWDAAVVAAAADLKASRRRWFAALISSLPDGTSERKRLAGLGERAAIAFQLYSPILYQRAAEALEFDDASAVLDDLLAAMAGESRLDVVAYVERLNSVSDEQGGLRFCSSPVRSASTYVGDLISAGS